MLLADDYPSVLLGANIQHKHEPISKHSRSSTNAISRSLQQSTFVQADLMLFVSVPPCSASFPLQTNLPVNQAGLLDIHVISFVLPRLFFTTPGYPHQMSRSILFNTLLLSDINMELAMIPLQPLPIRQREPLLLLFDRLPRFDRLLLV